MSVQDQFERFEQVLGAGTRHAGLCRDKMELRYHLFNVAITSNVTTKHYVSGDAA